MTTTEFLVRNNVYFRDVSYHTFSNSLYNLDYKRLPAVFIIIIIFLNTSRSGKRTTSFRSGNVLFRVRESLQVIKSYIPARARDVLFSLVARITRGL